MTQGLKPHPIAVPPRLLVAFQRLNARPVLVGGKAVQVWTGLETGLFQTFDLDFVTALRAQDFFALGMDLEASGRHLVIDGLPVEFPSGPLAVGDLQLDAEADSVEVETQAGGLIRCLRPEACVLDRLAQVAAWEVAEAFAQAAAIAVTQMGEPGWSDAWISSASEKAGLSNLWAHLQGEVAREQPREEALDEALRMGWD